MKQIDKGNNHLCVKNLFFSIISKMKIPGVGSRQKRFKKLVGWGKNGRKRDKRSTKKCSKLSGKLRSRRVKRNKDK